MKNTRYSRRQLFWFRLIALGLAIVATASLAGAYLQDVLQVAADQPGAPPRDAVVLFNGKDTSAWVHRNGGRACQWVVKEDGSMEVRGGDIITKQEFTDFQLHAEFRVPLMPDRRGQGRGNSGVYMQGRYEIQILDSYGLKLGLGDCGALYGQKVPDVNACLPPEKWQTYDILFHAPKFDADGKMTARPRISVLQNGLWIHENVEVNGRTTASMDTDPSKPGPIMLQDHGNPLRFRNIWLRPLNPSVS